MHNHVNQFINCFLKKYLNVKKNRKKDGSKNEGRKFHKVTGQLCTQCLLTHYVIQNSMRFSVKLI